MTDTIPACKTCKYFVDDDEFLPLCSNPKYNIRHTDFINGEVYYGTSLCVVNRKMEGECGEAGRGWDPKPAPEIPERQSILKWFNLF